MILIRKTIFSLLLLLLLDFCLFINIVIQWPFLKLLAPLKFYLIFLPSNANNVADNCFEYSFLYQCRDKQIHCHLETAIISHPSLSSQSIYIMGKHKKPGVRKELFLLESYKEYSIRVPCRLYLGKFTV